MGQLILPWSKATNQLTPLTPSSQMEANIHNIQSSPTNKPGINVANILRKKKYRLISQPVNWQKSSRPHTCPLCFSPHAWPPLILGDLVSSVSIRNKFHIQLVDTPKLTFFLLKPLTRPRSRSNTLPGILWHSGAVPTLCSLQTSYRWPALSRSQRFLRCLPYLAGCIAC